MLRQTHLAMITGIRIKAYLKALDGEAEGISPRVLRIWQLGRVCCSRDFGLIYRCDESDGTGVDDDDDGCEWCWVW